MSLLTSVHILPNARKCSFLTFQNLPRCLNVIQKRSNFRIEKVSNFDRKSVIFRIEKGSKNGSEVRVRIGIEKVPDFDKFGVPDRVPDPGGGSKTVNYYGKSAPKLVFSSFQSGSTLYGIQSPPGMGFPEKCQI